eukprot:scaffold62978_cov32-Phaeocystis_antarctica.AAC.1
MARDAVLLKRPWRLTKSDTSRCNHARHACSMKPRCPSCCQVEDGWRPSHRAAQTRSGSKVSGKEVIQWPEGRGPSRSPRRARSCRWCKTLGNDGNPKPRYT